MQKAVKALERHALAILCLKCRHLDRIVVVLFIALLHKLLQQPFKNISLGYIFLGPDTLQYFLVGIK